MAFLKKIKSLVPVLKDDYLPSLMGVYWNIFRYKNKALCLCFHDVSLSVDTYAISPDSYYEIIRKIRKRINSIESIDNKSIVITFDDGFESLYTTVLPFMEKEKLPFTCYITTGYIDKPGYLSASQLKALSESPFCTIGSHMISHRKTRMMSDEEVKSEWEDSKRYLEDLIGKPVEHAALPYGSFNSCTEKSKIIALNCGYKTIANTIASFFKPTQKELFRFVYSKTNKRVERIIERF